MGSQLPENVKARFMCNHTLKQGCDGVTVIIPVRGKERVNAVKINVEYVLSQNVYPIEVIVVEEDKETSFNEGDFKRSEVKRIFIHSDDLFNKAKCINTGIAKSKYNVICIHDADMIMPDSYLSFACKYLKSNFNNVCGMMYCSKQIYYLENVPTCKGNFIWNGTKWSDTRNWNFIGGSLFIVKNTFIELGGMDEIFKGYGCEDGEFYIRAKYVLRGRLLELRQDIFPLLHMPHTSNYDNVSVNEIYYETLKKMCQRQRSLLLKESLMKEYFT